MSNSKILLKSYWTRVTRNNAKLSKATPAEKRVMIARDVIAAIKAERLKPKSGDWVTIKTETKNAYNDPKVKDLIFGNADVRSALRKAPTCHTCALGACFVAAVDRFNGVTTDAVGFSSMHDSETGKDQVSIRDWDMRNHLENYFESEQLDLIENAFELGDGGTDYVEGVEGTRARNFGRRRKDVKERMMDIMQNIIENDGDFVPPKREDDPKSKHFRG